MQIQKRYWLGLLALALIAIFLFLSLPPSEPIVKDHPLSYWLDDIRSDNLVHSSVEFQKVLPAIDDRCIPALIDEVDWKPSPMLRTVERLSQRWSRGRVQIREPKDRRAAAAVVLGWLGSRASNAIPALENLSRLHDPESDTAESDRGSAIAALILIRHDSMETCARNSLDLSNPDRNDYGDAIVFLGTNAAPCVPIFVDAIKTVTNARVKICATYALGSVHSRPELSLSALETMLKEPDVASRFQAAAALGCFGTAAKPAWNNLAACLNDPDETVRFFTTNALQKIDPTAAQQLGISP